ncbi:CS1 type fimbrial major subunit [Yersinia mollaretii]|uniref:Alpha-related fimbriae minor subunit 1 n=1 Tax=Yersinia mollaretii TaxID=33060 RepID=A0AA36LPZ0_YERMO|nr:CS1 type fimbrial major subunit [Yersinia mollaretii]MDA5528317.1 CS1 type fimbrial major subunit [Yersinia mollaretii]MDR7874821.1 CS1 type fimbrial major subunit [Yersinia mollaretii]PHZ30819.1 hypothetical protein CS537_15540 [Yersinia mollaretii]WQC75052.1 CS1 type fimbrial major subunit [Yersinia mollaretii]CNF35398.1 alpha-related fimbriae minor subunit 1 [Yersinia mollaretii]
MKKTLLSIITMAILASGTVFAAHAVQKDIAVEAEIAESLIITMDKADGSPFNSLELGYYMGVKSQGTKDRLVGQQSIKITANQGAKVKILLAERFVMHHAKKDQKLYPFVRITDFNRRIEHILENNQSAILARSNNVALTVLVPDANTIPVGEYTGVLKFIMESIA